MKKYIFLSVLPLSMGLENSIRREVDESISKIFGAKYYLRMDWNLFNKPRYTLDEIKDKLFDSNIFVEPEVLVKEKLEVGSNKDTYFFKKVAGDKYELRYERSKRKD